MSRVAENLIAYRILSMLVQPFVETDAFKLGIIDKNGKNLIPSTDLKNDAEKDAYSYLHRLVFNVKRIINKTPGGESKLKNMIAALYLIKEQLNYKSDIDTISEQELHRIINLNVILAEETLQVKLFEDGAIVGQGQQVSSTEPTNKTTGPVSTQEPVIRKKKPPMVTRQSLKPIVVDLNQRAL